MKKQLTYTFEMTNLGLLHFFLGIQVLQMDDRIFISQTNYMLNILQKFRMKDYKPYATPYYLDYLGVKLPRCVIV